MIEIEENKEVILKDTFFDVKINIKSKGTNQILKRFKE